MRTPQRMSLVLVVVIAMLYPATAMPQTAPSDNATVAASNPAGQSKPGENLTREQMKNFMLTAKVIKSKQTSIGITSPWRLTLTDGTMTHDAGYQAVDEHTIRKQLADGRTELNFVDSYKYNIAGGALAEMLGLEDLIPPYVERKWEGKIGSISWWLPVKMDDATRMKQKIAPPDPDAWNKQMYRIRLFDQLVYDTDPNLTNILIGEDWHIWRIDFTRAFRPFKS